MKNLFVYENSYYYLDKYYKSYEQEFLRKILSKKLKVIILSQNILITIIKSNFFEIKNNILNYEEENNIGSDIIFDYKYKKSENKLFLYSIKGGDKISDLCYKANKINILPVQFVIKNLIFKKLKLRSYVTFIEINNGIYFLKVFEKFIIYSDFVLKEDFLEFSKTINFEENQKLVINDTLKAFFENKAYKIIDLGDFECLDVAL